MEVIPGGFHHRNHGFHFTGIAVSYDRTGGVTGAGILKENKKAAREKAKVVIEELRQMKLKEAADKLEKGIEENLPTWHSLTNTG